LQLVNIPSFKSATLGLYLVARELLLISRFAEGKRLSGPELCFKQDDEEYSGGQLHSDDGDDDLREAIRNDELRCLERAERTSAESIILLAAKIISPRICRNYEDGYDWCIEQVLLSRDRILINS